jgi:hypothetical protein
MEEKTYRIHPAVGFARLGNAERQAQEGRGWFIGPEDPNGGVHRAADGSSKDFKVEGKILSQGARFRIFEYSADGTAQDVRAGEGSVTHITWHVTLENRKAAFFKFLGFVGRNSLYGFLNSFFVRNRRFKNDREERLVLRTARTSIDSLDRNHLVSLLNQHVETQNDIPYLGQICVDEAGRLIVLGGHGKSLFVKEIAPQVTKEPPISTYANNDGWFDDVADGPVTATIHFEDGSVCEVDGESGAWVVSAPPDFAPGVRPVRSLWDTLVDLYVREQGEWLQRDLTHRGTRAALLAQHWDQASGRFSAAFKPSFREDIYPILQTAGRLVSGYQMETRPLAHRGLTAGHIEELGAANSDPVLRRQIFARIRPPDLPGYDTSLMPIAHGDIYFDATSSAPWWQKLLHRFVRIAGRLLTVSPLQYALLKKWADGEFEADWKKGPSRSADSLTPAELDRAALQAVSGGAFVPGIEASWLLTKLDCYAAPFRFKPGHRLAQRRWVNDIKIRPGFVTQQMALPWQADFADCKKEIVLGEKPQVAWWPWQRPDDVLMGGTGDRTGRGWEAWAPHQDDIEDDGKRFAHMVEHWHDFKFLVEIPDDNVTPQ